MDINERLISEKDAAARIKLLREMQEISNKKFYGQKTKDCLAVLHTLVLMVLIEAFKESSKEDFIKIGEALIEEFRNKIATCAQEIISVRKSS